MTTGIKIAIGVAAAAAIGGGAWWYFKGSKNSINVSAAVPQGNFTPELKAQVQKSLVKIMPTEASTRSMASQILTPPVNTSVPTQSSNTTTLPGASKYIEGLNGLHGLL
jgi:hypothetical protein